MSDDDYTIGEIGRAVKRIEAALDTLKAEFVTQTEFRPVARIVYGIVGVILLGVLGALVKAVLVP